MSFIKWEADALGLLSDTTMENLKGLPVEKLIVSPAIL